MVREVRLPTRTATRKLETYTVPEAAEALGYSVSNFRRWLENHLIPGPILVEVTRNHGCYVSDELEIIARELHAHSRDYSYLCARHVDTITRISQSLHGFRDIEFGVEGRTR